ncbi:metallophosphoesterase family protein [Olivibacter sitiensis]|uniref:metallophosphoesterase family protein n=1 Tax=Olivibacter sitiensis TaxID=376470 RepID=UPI00040501C3|nr:metallophosphoesterase [Olivibacter sitiensis]
MDRRKFLGATTLVSTGVIAMSVGNKTIPQYVVDANYSLTNNQIRFYDRAFSKSARVIFIADTHLWQSDEREEPYRKYSSRMAQAYNQTVHFQTGNPTSPMAAFEETLQYAVREKADLLVLGGDIFSYPSEAAIDWVCGKLELAGIPFVYTAGNHDWHYEGMEGSIDQLRKKWSQRRLRPLYGPHDPLMACLDLNGIRFIVIDNSTYGILPEQLAFFNEKSQVAMPIVLVLHIPLYAQGREVAFGCGHPDWRAATDKLYEIERRPRWPVEGHTKTTMEFRAKVFATSNMLAIFAGHIHAPSLDLVSGVPQFVAPPNLNGGFLDIHFLENIHDKL